ncbi:YceI family protein [Desulfovibrio ferrophilus]|uniref:YceI family protein n=1 Tax=Desulfovibrio ferrophilus TaxID=241368 RepID=A0A2Z6B3G1_9BACT|nr:YceI family protein [Desulfovibrio ferrophilus]BBD09985.1 YceI family protein [Desulfovibrio ferrophilus]
MKRVMLLVMILMTVLITSHAQARSWRIDNNHSQAVFTIRHIAGNVTGFFNNFEGTIIDPEIPGIGMIDIQIHVDSINTGVDKRDAHLKTPDFFDSANHPQLHFTSTKITNQGDGWFNAHGVLTIRNTNHPATLTFALTEMTQHPPFPGMECMDVLGFKAHHTLNRLDFGVGDGKFLQMGLVDNTVGITLQGELLSPREDCQ